MLLFYIPFWFLLTNSSLKASQAFFLLQTQPKCTHEHSWSLPCPLGLYSENLPCLFSESGSLKHSQTLLVWDQIKMLSHQARVSWFVFWFLQVAISRTYDLKHFQWKVQTVSYVEKKKTISSRRRNTYNNSMSNNFKEFIGRKTISKPEWLDT